MGRKKIDRTEGMIGNNILQDLDAETGELPEQPGKIKKKSRKSTQVHSVASEPPPRRQGAISDTETEEGSEAESAESGELTLKEQIKIMKSMRRENEQLKKQLKAESNSEREDKSSIEQEGSAILLDKLTMAVSSNRTISQPFGQMSEISIKGVKGLQSDLNRREKEGLKDSTPITSLIHENVQQEFQLYCIYNGLVAIATKTSWLQWDEKKIIDKMFLWTNHSQAEGNSQENLIDKKLSQIKGQLVGKVGSSESNLTLLKEIATVVRDFTSADLLASKRKLPMEAIRKAIRENVLEKSAMGVQLSKDWKAKPYPILKGETGKSSSSTTADPDEDKYDWSWETQNLALFSHYSVAMTALVTAQPYLETTGHDRKRHGRDDDDDPPRPAKATKAPKFDQPQTKMDCFGCGREGHKKKDCALKDHPDFNTEDLPWDQSEKGKKWLEKGKRKLPATTTLTGAKREVPPSMLNPESKKQGKHKHSSKYDYNKKVSHDVYCGLCNDVKTVKRLNNAMSHDCNTRVTYSDDLRTFTLPSINDTHPDLRVSVLLDSGALGVGSNYVSPATAEILRKMGYVSVECNETVCSCFVGSCHKINEKFKLKFRFLDKNNIEQKVTVFCRVTEIPYDIIIGRDVFKHCTKLREELFKDLSAHSEYGNHSSDDEMEVTSTRETKRSRGSHDLADPCRRKVDVTVNIEEKIKGLHEPLDRVQHELYQMSLDSNYIKEDTFGGSDEFKKKSRAVCEDLKDGFNRELNMEHALITPMEIEIIKDEWGKDLWGGREHMQAPRLQSREKNIEIFSQVLSMLKHKVIRESRASAHSQVMLTPKPNGKWRFCVDYRRLNVVTKPNHWPLPKIKEIFSRLGHKKPKYFAVIDLTKGYYQAPIAEHCKHLTAFITPNGLYEWERVAMGLCGAPSYFQRAMTNEVLVGLIYDICEVYLDDIIIHGQTEEEFLANLRKVLQRLVDFKITVNPDKCKIGLEEVEYVGHVINSQGMTFSPEKLQKVIDVDLPETEKDLRSFVGLANYFRDHVKNHSSRVEPLTRILDDYKPRQKINWDDYPKGKEAFDDIKQAINQCPMLFFVDETLDIHLYTDASTSGIGAYLCQKDETGKEYPIAFMSKSLNKTERNWGVPELEGYAIYAAFKQFDYLLRDCVTHIHTDHKNLVYIRESGSAKIIRWKMDLQEYRFTIQHIPGVDNPVADFWSRNDAADVDDLEETPKAVANMLCGMSLQQNEEESEIEHYLNAMTTSHGNSWERFEVPEEAYEKIKKAHYALVGHHGVENTMVKLHTQGHRWKYMREHVKRYIHECDTCQKASYGKYNVKVPKYVTGRYTPGERLNIDTIGPFKADEFGNKYILCMVDCFTRYMTLHPLKTLDADEAADAVLSHLSHFGVPCEVLSDGGKQYVNDILQELLECVGTQHIVSTAYSHEESSIVERHNGEVGRWLREILYDKSVGFDQWSKYLPFVQRIHNVSIIGFLGYAPAQLVYGDRVDLDRNILVPTGHNIQEEGEEITVWMSERRKIQEQSLKLAEKAQLNHNEKHVKVDNDMAYTEFEVGSYVLQSYPETGYGPRRPTKLHMMHKGPYEVLGHEGNLYTLRNLVTEKEETRGVFLLRPYFYNAKRTNPREQAKKDYVEEFDAEEIIAHTGKWSRKTHMKFTVKWEDFDHSHNTVQSWKDVADSAAMETYLSKHGHEKLGPRYQQDAQSQDARKKRKRKN